MSTIVLGRRPVDPVRRQGTEGPRPGLIETIGASWRISEDEQELTQAPRNAEAYEDLLDTLGRLGVDTREAGSLYMDAGSSIPGALRTHRVFDRDAIYAEVLRQRGRNPKMFASLPASREEFDQWVATRRGARLRDQRTVARGSLTGQLIGGFASGMTDPYNLASAPAGVGQASIVRTMLAEGLLGGVTELGNLSSTARAKARMGEEYTAADMAKQVGMSAGASAVLGGGVRAAEVAAPKIGATIDDTILRNWDRLPPAVRSRLGNGKWDKMTPAQREQLRGTMVIEDRDLPDLAEAIIGRANMSIDEKGAIDALRRDAEIAEVSPFKRGAAGDAAHRARLDDALSTILRPVEIGPRGRGLPPRPAMVASTPGQLRGSTSLAASRTPPRAALKARIRQVESSGNDAARNPLSSATGRYQFTSGTWLAYYKRRFGAQGLSNAAILAKRGDGRLQEVLMDDLTADNAAFLRSVGEAESAGNLYLTHFAGQGGARKLFRADPAADAGAVLGQGVVKANPWMRGMTAGDVIAWAHRKMKEPAPRRAGARSELTDSDSGEAAWRERLQVEIDRIDAESDAARATRGADDPLDGAVDESGQTLPSVEQELVPVDVDVDVDVEPASDVPQPVVPRDRTDDVMPAREAALLPLMRAEIAGTARLSDIEGLAKRLDASTDEIKLTLQRLAESDRSIVADKKGRYRRVPTDKGPVDAFKFLARAGGLTPHGLDASVEYIPKRKLIGAEKNDGHDLISIFNTKARSKSGGKRDQSILIPGAGPLIRRKGMSLDDAGEMLFAAGYLRGADGGRPTVAETISYLEQGMVDGPARLLPDNLEAEIDNYIAPETLDDMTAHMSEWAYYQSVELNADDIDQLARLMLRDDIENEDAALAALVNEAIVDALNDMRYELPEYDDALAQYLDTIEPDSRGERFAADPGDTGEGGARGALGEDSDRNFEGEDFDEWDSGTAPVADQQADSIIHDLDADPDLFGGPTRAERREALERQGDGGLSAGTEQKPAGSDGGLFDPAAQGQSDLPTFYLDEDGAARSWDDIASEIDADTAEIQNLKDCL